MCATEFGEICSDNVITLLQLQVLTDIDLLKFYLFYTVNNKLYDFSPS